MLFMRIRSPNKAPPVFFFDGSTEITAIVLSGKPFRNRRTISSVTLLLPAPPVPVIPTIVGSWQLAVGSWQLAVGSFAVGELEVSRSPFSACVISRAMRRISLYSPSGSCPFQLFSDDQNTPL